MKTPIIIVAFVVAGWAMANFGMTVFTWQYWVVLASMMIASIVSHNQGLDRS